MSNYFDFPFHIGENWKLVITARDGDGDVIDLTGATIQFRVASSSASLITATNGSGVTVSSPETSGVFTVDITPTMQTNASISIGDYRYECRITTAASLKTVQLRGNISVLPSLYSEFA